MIHIAAESQANDGYWPCLILHDGQNYYKLFIRAEATALDRWRGEMIGPGTAYYWIEGTYKVSDLDLHYRPHALPLRAGSYEGDIPTVFAHIKSLVAQVETLQELLDLLRMSDTL